MPVSEFQPMTQNSLETIHTTENRKAGRPRSEDSKRAILDSTRRLLTHMPIAKVSIEAIARKAGVGKTTIYRWWSNRHSVIMDAVFSQPSFHNILPASASAFDGITAQIEKLMKQLSGKNGRIVAQIIGDAQGDPEAMKNLIDLFFQDRYDALARYLSEGKANGEFQPDLDIESAIDLILAPIFFRLITGQALEESFQSDILNSLKRALTA